jgi:hypothetical protein
LVSLLSDHQGDCFFATYSRFLLLQFLYRQDTHNTLSPSFFLLPSLSLPCSLHSISSLVLASLFWPKSPTHDGAVVIRESRIAAAGCLLPLTEATLQDRRLGTRHRAAMGLSEVSDALVIVISEETGVISLAERGNLTRYLNKQALETRLFSLYKEEVLLSAGVLGRVNKWVQQNRWMKGSS